jgi:hypothetical protein
MISRVLPESSPVIPGSAPGLLCGPDFEMAHRPLASVPHISVIGAYGQDVVIGRRSANQAVRCALSRAGYLFSCASRPGPDLPVDPSRDHKVARRDNSEPLKEPQLHR